MHDFASQIISAATEADMIKQPTQPEEKWTKSQVHVFVCCANCNSLEAHSIKLTSVMFHYIESHNSHG